MTAVPGPGGQTLSLVCDSCGTAITDIDCPPDSWAVLWAVVSRAGWTGAPSPIGPHRCPRCGATGGSGPVPGPG